MEGKSDGTRNDVERFRALPGARRLTPEDILFGQRGTARSQRQAGMTVQCDLCRGSGWVRFGSRPLEPCNKCEGDGELTITEQQQEKREQLLYIAIGFLMLAAGFCIVTLFALGLR